MTIHKLRVINWPLMKVTAESAGAAPASAKVACAIPDAASPRPPFQVFPRGVTLMSRLVLLLSAAWLVGCVRFVPQPGPDADPPGIYLPLTLPFIALGDTQEHNATGYPLHENDSAVASYVEVAQRPPEQMLFGRRLLESVLSAHPDEPFLHLGDVMDLSCHIEAQRMEKIIRATPQPGAILPGNHDGLMFGIYAYNMGGVNLDGDARKWNHACRRGAAPDDDQHKTDKEAFTKRDFISLYITEHANDRPPMRNLVPPPQEGRHSISWRNPDPEAFLSGVEAELLDGVAYADSFLAQRLRLPRAPGATRDTLIIGLDTNQAGLLVSTWDTIMGRSPGSMGHIHPEQIRAVTHWVVEAVERGDIVIFAGHHNWQSLGLPSRILLRGLMDKLKHPLMYLSAHSHRGFWALHRAVAQQPLLELNVSSLSDWPLSYRRISFAYDDKAKRLLVRADLMPQGKKPNQTDADLLAAWKEKTCEVSVGAIERISNEDQAIVKRMRESRGNLLGWLVEDLAPICENCELLIYEHAQTYQNDLLKVLLELNTDLSHQAHRMHEATLPAWCQGVDFTTCAQSLLAERPTDFKSHVDLFRRKASLVAVLNDHLDDLDTPEAKAYMTCRAVQAANINFTQIPEDRNEDRGEAKRRMEQFFRIEASVGMN